MLHAAHRRQGDRRGFDVFEQPFEVKKRIGYFPETPPLYPEMSVARLPGFVGAPEKYPGSQIKSRAERGHGALRGSGCQAKLISKLSKDTVSVSGLAQAIIHNPDVLILDEPTSGLDPKQINETRELIKCLSGEHTIILSTHILPEVEAVCEKVIIINKGKLVATDSVENLKHRSRPGQRRSSANRHGWGRRCNCRSSKARAGTGSQQSTRQAGRR